jgi:hypothetical protein
MHKLLVDTFVWLDPAKDLDYENNLDVIEELISINDLSLLIRELVCNKGYFLFVKEGLH